MGLLEMLPLHVILVFVFVFINNVAMTSPQKTKPKGPPIFHSVPKTSFSCGGRTAGYYADPEAECQAYHMCDTRQKQFSYLCPAYTLFNQKYMVCDHWHAVNCSAAVFYYDLNERIGQVPDKKLKENNIIKEKHSQKLKKIKKDDLQKKPRAADLSSHFDNIKQIKQTSPFQKATPSFVSVERTQKPNINLPAHFRQPQRTFQLPDISPETTTQDQQRTKFFSKTTTQSQPRTKFFTETTTQRQSRTQFFTETTTTQDQPMTKFLIETTTQSQPKTKFTNFHTFPTTPATETILDFSHEDTTGFSINARGSGQRFKFGQAKKKDFHSKIINGVKLRPLFEKTKRPLVDKRNFTVAPDIFTPSSTPTVLDEDDDIDYDDENSLQDRNLAPEPIVPFLIPPLRDQQNELPIRSRKIPLLTPFLVPPPKGPIILEGSNQEIRTPLVVSKFFRSLRVTPPESEIIPPKFPFSRPNREFFIPAPGLLPPLPGNSISEEHQRTSDDPFIPHKMTMTFPTDTTMRRRRPFRFRINPNCPRCHPAFLKPNQCQPCVIIK